MNLLIIHQYFLGENDSGGSRFNQFVKYWSENGHKITVIAGMVNYTTGKKQEKYKHKFMVREQINDNVSILRTHVSEKYNSNFIGRLWAYFSFTVSSTIGAFFCREKFDMVLVTSPPLFVAITGYLTSKFKRIPLVFEVRDLWPESAIDIGVLKSKFLIRLSYWVEASIYKNASLINTLTPAFLETLVKVKKVPENKLIMIPNGADTDIISPDIKENWVRTQYGLENKFIVLYMGAHGVANNLITIIETAKKLENNKDIVFMLVGDGMQKQMLRDKAAEYKLSNVIFVDSQPKSIIGDFCNAADVCVAVLKKVDTFKTVYPNKVFDYMSCKRPIIIGIDGVARSLVETSQCGIFVEPENVLQLEEGIIKLYNNPDMCRDMGEKGYEYVIENFSRKKLAADYEKHLLKLL